MIYFLCLILNLNEKNGSPKITLVLLNPFKFQINKTHPLFSNGYDIYAY